MVFLPAAEIDHYEGRLEFWDGYTATAWKVSEPASIQHEGPSRRRVEMAARVASVRGSRIVSFGSADLVRLDAAGRERWLMQADEVRYLHPGQLRAVRVMAASWRAATERGVTPATSPPAPVHRACASPRPPG